MKLKKLNHTFSVYGGWTNTVCFHATNQQLWQYLQLFFFFTWNSFFSQPSAASTRLSDSRLTLLLKSCHDLHICHVLQFVAHGDGVVLQLWHAHITVQGRLRADRCMPATHIWKHTGEPHLSHQDISLCRAKKNRNDCRDLNSMNVIQALNTQRRRFHN